MNVQGNGGGGELIQVNGQGGGEGLLHCVDYYPLISMWKPLKL